LWQYTGGVESNATLWISVFAWFAASFLKVLVFFAKTRQLKFSVFVSSGGMPSAHSAFVTALATSVGIYEGFDSPIFAVAAVVAVIVMYDASGVRRAAGRQAQVINKMTDKMVESFKEFADTFDMRLKEVLGHSPLEVFAGGLLGTGLAVIAGYFI
jgi:hypothetical protein